jgi:hypothetical protein
MKKTLLILVPSLLICGIVIAFKSFSEDNDCVLETGKSYEVWLKEAEVSAFDRSGESWDTDGSAPDLRGMISWQDQVVLQTVEASDGLIARWGDTAISASQAIQGEADTQSLQRVGRFRMDAEGSVETCIFDNDLGSHSYAGGFRISLSSLRLGDNYITGAGTLKSVTLCVREADAGGNDNVPKVAWVLTDGVQELNEPPFRMLSGADKLFTAAENTIDQTANRISDEIQELGDTLGEKLEKNIQDTINNLKKSE